MGIEGVKKYIKHALNAAGVEKSKYIEFPEEIYSRPLPGVEDDIYGYSYYLTGYLRGKEIYHDEFHYYHNENCEPTKLFWGAKGWFKMQCGCVVSWNFSDEGSRDRRECTVK